MSAVPQQQQNQGDNALGPMWIVAGIFVGLALIWYFFHIYIVEAWFKIKLFELSIIGLFTQDVQQIVDWIHQANAAAVRPSDIVNISNFVGGYLSYPVAGLLLIGAFVIYLGHNSQRFNRKLSMQQLLEIEKENWPQVVPVSKLNLVEQSPEEGPWAMGMTPMQFAKKYKLLDVKEVKGKVRYEAKVIKGRANLIFDMQLGRPWTSLENLPIHARALFAAFAACGNRDREGAYNLLEQIADSTETGKLDFSGVDKLLAKHVTAEAVGRVVGSHAYELTVMASMLVYARTSGVVAAAEFIWLKPLDRRLWFVLNSVGRLTSMPEVAGPFAHWLAEKELGMPLKTPMTDQAVLGLEAAMAEKIYDPSDKAF